MNEINKMMDKNTLVQYADEEIKKDLRKANGNSR
jgi:hypothetical protein